MLNICIILTNDDIYWKDFYKLHIKVSIIDSNLSVDVDNKYDLYVVLTEVLR